MSSTPTPSPDELAALLECFRYGSIEEGDFDDIKRFTEVYGEKWLSEARDERGNTCLHMAAGNGHTEIVRWLLPFLPAPSLVAQNLSLSTPLHWSTLNFHLPTLELLCPLLPLSAYEIKNEHGKTAVQEAEEATESLVVGEEDQETDKGRERVRREKVVGYVLGCMGLGVKAPTGGHDSKAEEADEAAPAAGAEDDETVKRLTEQAEKLKVEQEEARKKKSQEEKA
ncbi:hypothetical protein JCM8547_003575 [Rhodosporidiobolus lusitaniae]